ncbi:hypothetical protein AURDEDRAFT_108451 [Auricularia subglabra TFB-10046 SS5]|uniref:Uncharacterized protein n=1 Tax=Auricularia subglabra (strain TFB-10046 / SS5) TaxID=717982 RepID=J0D9Y3_AURST|nr:hypothetical protein AURDEDRAFT_108451 [Auricularia subglabra TFB-10046 SS5]
MKQTVLGLVRDLVKLGSSPDAISILQSCAEACRARNLSLEAILQEPSIEGHAPLYWAILKNSSQAEEQHQISLVDLLMSFPLTPAVIAEARQACLLNSDDVLFQRLRRSPGCAGLSATDELLLGSPPADLIQVENAPGDHGAFKVSLHFVHFQKRMRVSRAVRAEFIARGASLLHTFLPPSASDSCCAGRIWYLQFSIAGATERYQKPAGTWIVSVGLVDDSPSTHLDSRLSILPGTPLSPASTAKALPSAPASPTPGSWTSQFTSARTSASNPRPPIDIRLRTSTTQLGEREYNDGTGRKRVIAALADSPRGASLEFDGCPHINFDGSLDAVFEADLKQSGLDSDCIIS